MENTNSEGTDTVNDNTWVAAKKYSRKIGYIPSSFTTAIKTLVFDQLKNDGEMRPTTKYQVARLLKGPSFKSMFYHASVDLRGGYIKESEHLTIGDMMAMYEPFDIAAMIASYVFYRKCKKALGPESWVLVSDELARESLIGSQMGVALPGIGIGIGLLVSIVPYFALCMLILEDPKKFKEYRRHLTKAKLDIDLNYEEKLWGCSRVQTSMMLLCAMGFGVDITESFIAGIDPKRKYVSMQEDLHRRMKLGALWIECLLKGHEQPREKIPGEYYPMVSDRLRLEEKVKLINAGCDHWLDKNKSDVSPEKTPQLFGDIGTEGEIPDELVDVFSMKEITEMEEEDFDDLIDQIDLDQEERTKKGSVILSSKELEDLEEMVE